MKVTTKIVDSEFQPMVLEIHVEKMEEAQALYAVFNLGPICDYLRDNGIESDRVRRGLDKINEGADNRDKFINMRERLAKWFRARESATQGAK